MNLLCTSNWLVFGTWYLVRTYTCQGIGTEVWSIFGESKVDFLSVCVKRGEAHNSYSTGNSSVIVVVVLLAFVWPRGCAVLGRFWPGYRRGSGGVNSYGGDGVQTRVIASSRADRRSSGRERGEREIELNGTLQTTWTITIGGIPPRPRRALVRAINTEQRVFTAVFSGEEGERTHLLLAMSFGR